MHRTPLLMIPLLLGLVGPEAHAESARMKALRARLQGLKTGSAPVQAKAHEWVPVKIPGTYSIPQECADRVERLVPRLWKPPAGEKNLYPRKRSIPCDGPGDWAISADSLPGEWTFLDNCKPLGKKQTEAPRTCPDGFIGFANLLSYGSNSAYIGIRPSPFGGFAPDSKDVLHPVWDVTVGVTRMNVPEALRHSGPFVRTRIQEGEREGVYYGQVKDGLPHGFGMAIFPGNYAFAGSMDRGWTQGPVFQLETYQGDGQAQSAEFMGHHEHGALTAGIRRNWHMVKGRQGVHESSFVYSLYAGGFQNWRYHGEGRLRQRYWGHYPKGRSLSENGRFDGGVLVEGEKETFADGVKQKYQVTPGGAKLKERWVANADLRPDQVILDHGHPVMVAGLSPDKQSWILSNGRRLPSNRGSSQLGELHWATKEMTQESARKMRSQIEVMRVAEARAAQERQAASEAAFAEKEARRHMRPARAPTYTDQRQSGPNPAPWAGIKNYKRYLNKNTSSSYNPNVLY